MSPVLTVLATLLWIFFNGKIQISQKLIRISRKKAPVFVRETKEKENAKIAVFHLKNCGRG